MIITKKDLERVKKELEKARKEGADIKRITFLTTTIEI